MGAVHYARGFSREIEDLEVTKTSNIHGLLVCFKVKVTTFGVHLHEVSGGSSQVFVQPEIFIESFSDSDQIYSFGLSWYFRFGNREGDEVVEVSLQISLESGE